MFPELDQLFKQLWNPIVKLLCGLTGQSNFTLARCALWLTIGLAVEVTLWPVIGRDALPSPLTVLSGAIWGFGVCPWFFRRIRKLEHGAENGSSVFALSEQEMRIISSLRTLNMFALVFYAIMPGHDIRDVLFNVCAAAAGYLATHYRPKRKSVVKKLARAAWHKRPRVAVPSPTHQPTPA